MIQPVCLTRCFLIERKQYCTQYVLLVFRTDSNCVVSFSLKTTPRSKHLLLLVVVVLFKRTYFTKGIEHFGQSHIILQISIRAYSAYIIYVYI